MSPAPLLALLVCLSGCVHMSMGLAPSTTTDQSANAAAPSTGANGDLVRDDWMVVPGRHGGHEVITRTQYLDDRAKHLRPKMPSLSAAPPALTGAVAGCSVAVGQVRSYKMIDELVKRMHVTGTSAKVYWTTPYFIQRIEHGKFVDHPGSDIHVEGVEPGQSQLILDMTDGSSRTFDIQVHGPAGTAQRT